MLTLNAGSALAANGCGPADWRGRFVPNSPIGFQFGPACNWHDRCYATPWNRVAYSYAAAKDHCDRWFYFKMSQVCAYQGGRTDYQLVPVHRVRTTTTRWSNTAPAPTGSAQRG